MALTHSTWFQDRAILANDTVVLDEQWRDLMTPSPEEPSNQRSFTNYTTFPSPAPPGVSGSFYTHIVFFNGSYPELTSVNDVNLVYLFYYNALVGQASLGFTVFDPKFLAPDLFELAVGCGIINGDLFSAYSNSQLSLEQIVITDEVNAIDYSGLDPKCDRPEFRNYTTYHPNLISFGNPVNPPRGCALNGTTLPADQNVQEPCKGMIDVQFSSMLVTTQTSQYERDRIQMLTDEGGIVGGIMFVTWFLSIVNQ